MLKIIVGLGNFTHTGSRHNMGMLALDHLVSSLLGPRSFVLNKNLGGWIASGDITLDSKRHSLVFYKPKEYMNLNGIPIARTRISC